MLLIYCIVMLPKAHVNSNIVKHHYNLNETFSAKYVVYSSDGKAELSAAATPVFSVT